MKNILFVTGTRADFGKIEPLAVAARDNGFSVTFFITGMHMLQRYGDTRREVRNFVGADFYEFVNQREEDPLDLILSKTILGLSDFISEHKPDLVVIHGDRIEAFAASIVCAMNYIRSAHIEGGEVSGTIDESLRHCNSKLCHSHFVSSDSAAERVNALGESRDNIYIIGSPELDIHSKNSGVHIREVKKRYEIDFDKYGVVLFHPVTSELDTIGAQAESLFSALIKSNKNYVVVLPNNDPGTEKIIDVISRLPLNKFRVIPSMRFLYFSELMKNSSIIIGNSSAGVREAPFLGVPSIDIGSRQNKRSLSGSVANVSAFDVDLILNYIDQKWDTRLEPSLEFGVGSSCDRFIAVLKNPVFWTSKMQKTHSL